MVDTDKKGGQTFTFTADYASCAHLHKSEGSSIPFCYAGWGEDEELHSHTASILQR